MRYLPTFLDLSDRACLIVGGGEAAARKVSLLRKSGARIAVVAPGISDELRSLAEYGDIHWDPRAFDGSDVRGKALVISATGVEKVDRAVSEAAQTASVPVNVVDRPELCSFITPSIVDRDPVLIGISSSGTSPVLARRIRAGLEASLPAQLGRLARFADAFRQAVKASLPTIIARRRFWEDFFSSDLAHQVLAGEEVTARKAMLKRINSIAGEGSAGGRVDIVGAGPGDPDLLTLKALQCLQDADVVVYDRLVGPEILDYARRDALRIYVGKAPGRHHKPQREINALLVEQAKAGRRVVRLKGGDPFVFGRGGEEQAWLRRHGVPVTIVPGITAATGCAASTGIPLTLRGTSQAVTFVTGHARSGEPDLDWQSLANLGHSLVIYMGVETVGVTAQRLTEHGLPEVTPAAVVENGTLPQQRIVMGTLGTLESLVRDSEITGPALIVIGDVVSEANAAEISELAEAI